MAHTDPQTIDFGTREPYAQNQWPADVGDLPAYMLPPQLADLLGLSLRTLERHRHEGTGIPFLKIGRRILYARDDVIAALGAHRYASTAEAKRDSHRSHSELTSGVLEVPTGDRLRKNSLSMNSRRRPGAGC